MNNEILMAFTKEIDSLFNGEDAELPYDSLIVENTDYGIVTSVKVIAPFSKVVYVATGEEYVKNARIIFDAVKRAGGFPLGITVDIKSLIDIDKLSVLFSLPSDVRAVITTQSDMAKCASYFAGIRGITHITVVRSPLVDGILSPTAMLKTGDKIERVTTNTNKLVIVDADAIESSNETAAAYLNVMQSVISLYDYGVFVASDGNKLSKLGYSLISSAVSDTFSGVTAYSKGINFRLLINGLKVELGNYLSSGEIKDYSSTVQVKMLLDATGYDSTVAGPIAFKRILKQYAGGTFGVFGESLFEDCVEQAKNFAKTLSVNSGQVLSKMLSRMENANKNKQQISAVITAMENQLPSVDKIIERVDGTYSALDENASSINQGKKGLDWNKIFSLAGYFPIGLNGLTLIR